jgi:Kelch motif
VNATRRLAACAAIVGIAVVGCGSGSLHGRSAAESSGVVPLSSSASVVSPSSSAPAASPSASASALNPLAGTAATLIADHWSQLPAAPLAPRINGVVAWTGTHLLVWGGASSWQSDATLFADGASYDPAIKQWTTLPPAPISARTEMGWVWTGTSLVVFGGSGSASTDGTGDPLSDGSIYTPSTNSWRKLPAAPLSPRFNPQLLWTGREVLVIGGDPPNLPIGPGYAAGEAAYDPSTNRWRELPPMPSTPGHEVRHLRAMVTDRGVYVGQLWQHITTDGDSVELDAGVDFVVYDPAHNTWTKRQTSAATNDDQPPGLDGVTVAGDQLLVLPGQGWHGDSSTWPGMLGGHGYRLDLATGTWSAMSAGPIDKTDPIGVWTGSALLEYTGTMTSSLDGGPTTGPGESAVWDPETDVWTALPTAPGGGFGDTAVWASDRLLEWGLSGLQFGP